MNGRKVNNQKYWFAVFLFFLFCLFPAWGGDYFHYREAFRVLKNGYFSHMEEVYIYIVKNIANTYFEFRLIVWGGAAYLLLKTFKNLSLDSKIALCVFCLLFMPRFSYARVSLAMVLGFFGASIILKRFNFWRLITGLVLIGVSFFFHKTAAFGIGVILLSFLLNRFLNKKVIILLIALIPVMIIIMENALTSFVDLDLADLEGLNIANGQRYLGDEIEQTGLGTRISEYLMRLSYYSILVEYVLFHIKGLYKGLPSSMKVFSTSSFLIILFASLFIFDLGFSTGLIYNRFMYFAMIPSGCFIAFCVKEKYFPKWTKFVLLTGIVSCSYALVYSFYLSMNSPYQW